MADNSVSDGLSKVVAVGGVVGILYFLITELGFGGRGEGKGDGHGESSMTPPTPPSRPHDMKRLSFVMQEPVAVGHSMVFRLRDEDPSTKTYTLEETIARIKAGGRSDTNLLIRGSVLQGPASKALELFKAAGIVVWKEEGPTGKPHVSGNARGRYGYGYGHGHRRTW